MVKYGFKIKTRGGMILENLAVTARDRTAAEAKISQIYHHCEFLDCVELVPDEKPDSLDLESAISLISRQRDRS
jgi:hypothetical protein